MRSKFSLTALVLTAALASSQAAQSQQPLREFKGSDGAIRNLVISADGQQVAAGFFAASVRVWNMETGVETHALKSGDGITISAAFMPDGKSLAIASLKDGTVRLWDLATSQEVKVIARHPGAVHHIAISRDGKYLASAGGAQNEVRCTDIATGKQLASWRHNSSANTVAFSSDGKWLASCGDDKQVMIWNLAAGKLERTLTGHNDTLAGLTFSLEGTLVYSGSRDGTVREFEIATGKRLRKWVTGKGQARTLALSPDGRSMAVATERGEAQIWELATLKQRRVIRADRGFNWSLAFTPDGKSLATAGDEQTIRLWDVTGGFRIVNNPKAAPFTAQELTTFWDALAGVDAPAAYTAIWALASRPGQSVPFVAQQLKGDNQRVVDGARFTLLIKQLDHDRFVEREKAFKELGNAGLRAREAMESALKGEISEEQRRRLEKLLKNLGDITHTPDELRRFRVLEFLARIDSPEAKQLVSELTKMN